MASDPEIYKRVLRPLIHQRDNRIGFSLTLPDKVCRERGYLYGDTVTIVPTLNGFMLQFPPKAGTYEKLA